MTPFNPSILEPIEQWAQHRLAGASLDTLAPSVEYLSKAFTDERPDHFDTYLERPNLLTAYALFFMPQTVARVYEALQGILARLPAFPDRPLRILDLGCGLGAGLLAARAIFGPETELTGVDWSETALEALPVWLPGVKTVKASLKTYVPDQSYDIILSSFAWNEIFLNRAAMLEAIQRMLPLLSSEGPSFFLLLEPASKEKTPTFLSLKNELADYPLYAPCPHRKRCPLIRGKEGICHDVRPFRPTASMQRLNRHLYRSINDVKYALLAIGRKGGPLPEGDSNASFFRMIGPMDKGKGVLTCRVCMGNGQVCKLELPMAGLSSQRRHILLDHVRGDCAWLEGPLGVQKQFGNIQRAADVRFTDEPEPIIEADDGDFKWSF